MGIDALNRRGDVDVIIVARGGGSAEELSAFNEEGVARAVFGSLVPVVSAVGHETDTTICDYVADQRAPTPSAAAEMVAPDRAHLALRIAAAMNAAQNLSRGALGRDGVLVENAMARSFRAMPDVSRLRQRILDFERRAAASVDAGQRRRVEQMEACERHLEALNPQATLNRGYAVLHKGGSVVSSIGDVSTGDRLVIKVADGGFPARVDAPGTRRRRSRPAAERTNGRKPKEGEGVQKAMLF
jgi:exodeoxyribonuclease VII large subunit